jgi:uncharacterized protein (DUF3084 family)
MKKFLIVAPLALAAVAAVATPASAASWYDAGELRAQIAQLDRQVDRMRGLSPREEHRLENQVDRLQAMYRDYARGGFNRAELQRLNGQVSAVKTQVRAQSHDRNGRFDRHDDHGRYDDHRGPDRRDHR